MIILAILQTPSVLERAHAHNDYVHKRPLVDALENGFSSVEADVFLEGGKLLVAHDRKDLKLERSLEALYLAPLAARIRSNSGWVYPNGQTIFWVLIDIKEKGPEVYAELKRELAAHSELAWSKDRPSIRFVLSGQRPIEEMIPDAGKFAGLDGRIKDMDRGFSTEFMPWVSESWSSLFKWIGKGEIPPDQIEKLRSTVARIHAQGRKVRFWGASDNENFWKTQWEAGIDFLNIDQLTRFRSWALKQR